MSGVIAILAAVLVLGLVLRVGVSALVLTGLARDVARFQVRSAFFGVGYTTSEAEAIVNHPVRRRIVQMLLVAGSVGIAGVAGSAVISLAREDGGVLLPLLTLVGGLAALYVVSSVDVLDRLLARSIEAALRRFTSIDANDYDALLRLSGEYAVTRLTIQEGGLLDGRSLAEAAPGHAGIVLLGIERGDGSYLGAPPHDTLLQAGDRLTVYGRETVLSELGG